MNDWEDLKADYPTRLSPTTREQDHCYASFTDWFVTLYQTERVIFALWDNRIFYSHGHGRSWRSNNDSKVIDPKEFIASFPHQDKLTNLDPHKGTALFDGKQLKWNKKGQHWTYNNNFSVDFDKETHSSADYTPEPEEDNDTAKVAELLQRTEHTVTAATEKLQQLRQPASRSDSPARRLTSRETSPFHTRTKSPAQEPSQTATPPVSKGKGKQPASVPSRVRTPVPSTIAYPTQTAAASSSLHTPRPTPAPSQPPKAPTPPPAAPTAPVYRPVSVVVPAPQPPGGNPPTPPPAAAPMAQQNAPPRPIGNPPEPFDGVPAKAQSFWNALNNYYTLNADAFTTMDKKVASALGYFKIGTRAGDWATKRMETTLMANPVTYGTWDAFKDDFKAQFIPPQLKAEAISNMHSSPMGTQDFNTWYQTWSTYARDANVDAESKMFAFRRNLNPGLNAKLVNITPQPTTLDDLVAKVREIDKNWQIYGQGQNRPRGSFPRRGRGIAELSIGSEDATINVATSTTRGRGRGRGSTFRKRGRLSPEERATRIAKNLCLYCGEGGHKAAECTKPPNRRPNAPVRQLETTQENQLPQEDLSETLEKLQVNHMQTSNIVDMDVDAVPSSF